MSIGQLNGAGCAVAQQLVGIGKFGAESDGAGVFIKFAFYGFDFSRDSCKCCHWPRASRTLSSPFSLRLLRRKLRYSFSEILK